MTLLDNIGRAINRPLKHTHPDTHTHTLPHKSTLSHTHTDTHTNHKCENEHTRNRERGKSVTKYEILLKSLYQHHVNNARTHPQTSTLNTSDASQTSYGK